MADTEVYEIILDGTGTRTGRAEAPHDGSRGAGGGLTASPADPAGSGIRAPIRGVRVQIPGDSRGETSPMALSDKTEKACPISRCISAVILEPSIEVMENGTAAR